MPDVALFMRLLAMEANIDSHKLRLGTLSPADLNKIQDSLGRISDAPLWLVDMPNMRLMDLCSQARRLRAQQHVEIIFVDYLTLISTDINNRYQQRYEVVGEISRTLKSLARELDIPIVALSQVRREAEGKGTTKSTGPGLADLRESGSIEQDADVVMFLHRERNKPGDEAKEVLETELNVAKNRNGPTGMVKLGFKKAQAQYVSLTSARQ
jgi:replicative DNA helicase